MRRMHQFVGLGLGIMATMTSVAIAVEFRIDTKLFSSGGKTPIGQNLTLFADGVVYDFARELNAEGQPGAHQEIAIFHPTRQKFILLDTARQVRMEIGCEELFRFAEDLRNEARKSDNAAMKFSADPRFTENFNRNSGLLTLTSGVIDYRVETVRPPSKGAVEKYGQFADWYARLNATHPGAAPPFPRLDLNAVLVNHGVVPTRVERTISGPGSGKSTAWTEHQVSWQLTRSDKNEMDQADRFQVEFKLVSFKEYRRIAEK